MFKRAVMDTDLSLLFGNTASKVWILTDLGSLICTVVPVMEISDAEVELTSKQKRRAKKRAAIKAIAAGTTVDAASVKIKASENAPSTSDLKSSVADASISKKSKVPLRKPNKVDGMTKVATLEGSESEIDPALMAELANLVRECAASNPDAIEDTKPVDFVENKRLPSKKRTTAIEQQEPAETVLQKPAQNHVKGAGKDKSSSWNFAVDYNDHFETPLVAYTDILPMLLTLAESLGKLPKDLVIYDPYYCQGGMVQMLAGMGFPKVLLVHLHFPFSIPLF
jgi:hypothetical protein